MVHELVLALALVRARQSLKGWRAAGQLKLAQVPEWEQLLAPELWLLSEQGLVQVPALMLGLALQLLLDGVVGQVRKLTGLKVAVLPVQVLALEHWTLPDPVLGWKVAKRLLRKMYPLFPSR